MKELNLIDSAAWNTISNLSDKDKAISFLKRALIEKASSKSVTFKLIFEEIVKHKLEYRENYFGELLIHLGDSKYDAAEISEKLFSIIQNDQPRVSEYIINADETFKRAKSKLSRTMLVIYSARVVNDFSLLDDQESLIILYALGEVNDFDLKHFKTYYDHYSKNPKVLFKPHTAFYGYEEDINYSDNKEMHIRLLDDYMNNKKLLSYSTSISKLIDLNMIQEMSMTWDSVDKYLTRGNAYSTAFSELLNEAEKIESNMTKKSSL